MGDNGKEREKEREREREREPIGKTGKEEPAAAGLLHCMHESSLT
jgi:hypothetical protein